MKTKWLAATLVLFALLVVCGISCFVYMFINAHDYAVSLGHGYRYFGAKENRTVIDRGFMSEAENNRLLEKWDVDFKKNIDYDLEDIGAPCVGPNVDGYRVYSRVITGHVSKPHGEIAERKYLDQRTRKLEQPGYFIIDTRANRIYRGLSKQEWRVQLRKYGVDDDPKLFKPTGNKGGSGDSSL